MMLRGETKGRERNRTEFFGKERACENGGMKRTGHV